MKKYIDLREEKEYEKLEEAGKVIKSGGLVLFPTETVYGLGANGLDEIAVKKIFEAKGRKTDNPLILHISEYDMLSEIVKETTEVEKKLIKSFWPGPFTIILPKTDKVPKIVSGGLNTVGIRMPSGIIAQKLIEYAGVPIAAPSANISGRPSGTKIEDIYDELKDKVDYIIDGGETEIGLESTVVRVIDGIPHILRPGKITAEEIKKVANNVEIDSHVLNKTQEGHQILSPGMKYRHYAPKSKCILVYSQKEEQFIKKANEIAKQYQKPIILTKTENISKIEEVKTIDMGKNLEEISKNIFAILRSVDKYNPDIVIIQGVEKQGLGLAIMNRLIRACEYNYIEI